MNTYKNIPELETMTAQEVFDKALAHVRATGKQSFDSKKDRCAYSGVGCAASVFLQKQYHASADKRKDSGWLDLVASNDVVSNHEELISALQHAHDITTQPEFSKKGEFCKQFEDNMKNVAKLYNVEYTPNETHKTLKT